VAISENSSFMIGGCIPLPYIPTVDLLPNQIIVFAVPYFKKGKEFEVRAKFLDAHSEPFKLSIDPKIIASQRESHIDEIK